MVNGVQAVCHLEDAVAVTELAISEPSPNRCVGILRTILAHARRITLDVAGIGVPALKRWGQQTQDVPFVHQVALHCAHGL